MYHDKQPTTMTETPVEAPAPGAPRIGYVVKMYPRFSETFIMTEILSRELAGEDIEIFALRQGTDSRFHAKLAEVAAPVTYLQRSRRVDELWDELRAGWDELPGLKIAWPEFLRAEVEDAFQGVQLARKITQQGITHLHAHFASAATSVARLASLATGIPYSFTAHAKDIFHESVDPDDVRRKLEDASHTITVSDYNLKFLQDTYGEAARRIVRVYNGVDLKEFDYQAPESRRPVVLAVGRLVEKKGFEDLVRACAILREENRNFTCRIVGTGPLDQPLRNLIRDLNLDDRVTMLGPQPQHVVRAEIRAAAVFAAPCVVGSDGNQDGLPTVLLEAMALGTPCISTDVTGIIEAVKDGETGIIVPQHSPAVLADAIGLMFDNAELRASLAQSARTHIEDNFDTLTQAVHLRQQHGYFQKASLR